MSEKSHVSLGQSVCPVCGIVFDSGEVLLHKRLAQVLERKTVTGYALCPEHQGVIDSGMVILIVISNVPSGEGVRPMKIEEADRTGDLMYLRKEVAHNIGLDRVETIGYIDRETHAMMMKALTGATVQ